MKNSGYLPIEWKDTHKVFGADTGVVHSLSNPYLDWKEYYTPGEKQHGVYFDSMACVSFSANKAVEAVVNYQIKHKLLSQPTYDWLKNNGYLVDGKLNLSDRFLAKVSGTTKQGNSADKVADAFRHCGAVPEALWSFPVDQRTPVFDWDDFYKDIPQNVLDLGINFAKRLNIQYEFVSTNNNKSTKSALEFAPIQVFGHAWDKPYNGIYQRSVNGINHAFSLFKPEWFARDHYIDFDKDFDKQLATDYLFNEHGVLYSVTDNKLTYNNMAKILKDKKSSAVGVLKLANSPADLIVLAKEAGIDISEPINWTNTINGTYELKNNFMGIVTTNSDLFKLNWRDVLNGFIMFVGTAVLTTVLSALQGSGEIVWSAVADVALISTIIYLLKNVFTDDSNKLLGKW